MTVQNPTLFTILRSKNMSYHSCQKPLPPSFEEAKNYRQKARSAGLDPDHWYVVEHDSAVLVNQVKEVVFWNTSIALFRGNDGNLSAIENRCPHRQLKLSHGVVDGCRLRCIYHGWAFDRDGTLVDYSHDSFGKPLIKSTLRTYPVQIRYGLIWLFPGDPTLASDRGIPNIPELTGKEEWAHFSADFVWRAHHSMVVDNISDFSHAFLHRKYKPFIDAKLTYYESDENHVYLTYDTQVAGGRISGLFIDRNRVNTQSITLCYDYPYQWSNTGDSIKNWAFLLPLNESYTRVFFLFYFDSITIPFLSIKTPKWLTQRILNIAKYLVFRPILNEDKIALEAEQYAYETHWDEPPMELNPVVPLFQKLIAKKWQNHIEKSKIAAKD